MTTVAPTSSRPSPVTKFENGAAWWHALGDVPLERVVMDPPPGTATEHDLLLFVERDKRLVELIDGTLVEKPMVLTESLLAGWLITYLNMFVGPRGLGIVSGEAGTIRMISGRVRLPDVAFISVNDLPGGALPDEPIPTLAPTIAIEVLNPGNTKAEIRQKLKEYFESGTRLAWIVDGRARTVAVYEGPTELPSRTLTAHDSLDGGKVIPGFVLALEDLFSKLPS